MEKKGDGNGGMHNPSFGCGGKCSRRDKILGLKQLITMMGSLVSRWNNFKGLVKVRARTRTPCWFIKLIISKFGCKDEGIISF